MTVLSLLQMTIVLSTAQIDILAEKRVFQYLYSCISILKGVKMKSFIQTPWLCNFLIVLRLV